MKESAMTRYMLVGSLTILAVFAAAAVGWADDKSDVQGAVKKLADSANYSWTTTVEGGRGRGPSDGKTEKNGYTSFTINFQNEVYEVILQGEKAAIKMDNRWMSQAEVQKAADDAGGFSPELIVTFRIGAFKTPAAQAKDITETFTNLKKSNDSYTADLAEATAKDLLTFRRPAGAGQDNVPQMTVKDAKGTLKIWVQDGAMTKLQVHLTGTRTFNDQDQPVDQTSTTEIKEVGTTKITVPDEAKKKLEMAKQG